MRRDTRREIPYLSVFSPNKDQNNSEYGHFLRSDSQFEGAEYKSDITS